MKKLHISPDQSPTTDLPPPNTDRDSPAVSQIQPTHEQYPDRDLNAPTIFEAPPPNRFHIRPETHELTTPNASYRPPKAMPHLNYNAELYGKITHPVEKLLTEIPYTCLLYTSSVSHSNLLVVVEMTP